jgi:C4-dicarboxylate transporter DctQ subunit
VTDRSDFVRIERFGDGAARVLERVLALGFIAAVLLNFVNVVERYLFGRSILSGDELQIYMMIVMVFLGAAVVSWRRQHLRMDVLVDALPAGLHAVVRIFEFLVAVVLSAFVCWESAQYAADMYKLGRLSDMAQMPMWLPHSAVALGFGLILIVTLWRGFTALRAWAAGRKGARP